MKLQKIPMRFINWMLGMKEREESKLIHFQVLGVLKNTDVIL